MKIFGEKNPIGGKFGCFPATVDASQEDGWFEALRDLIAHLQTRRIWSSEFPINAALEDVSIFVFFFFFITGI